MPVVILPRVRDFADILKQTTKGQWKNIYNTAKYLSFIRHLPKSVFSPNTQLFFNES